MVSGPTPFPAGCPGAAFDATMIPGQELEPSITVNRARPSNVVAAWIQDVGPDSSRTDVTAFSRDGGRTFGPPAQVHADGWKIAACPHRGGSVATDARGRLYAVWYTEGAEGRPDLLFASSADGRRFSAPRRLHTAPGSIPDQARLAVDASGRAWYITEGSLRLLHRAEAQPPAG